MKVIIVAAVLTAVSAPFGKYACYTTAKASSRPAPRVPRKCLFQLFSANADYGLIRFNNRQSHPRTFLV